MTNSEFAREDEIFLKVCNTTEFRATTRQASKWRMKKGIAYKTAHNIPLNLQEDKTNLYNPKLKRRKV